MLTPPTSRPPTGPVNHPITEQMDPAITEAKTPTNLAFTPTLWNIRLMVVLCVYIAKIQVT